MSHLKWLNKQQMSTPKIHYGTVYNKTTRIYNPILRYSVQ